MVNNLPTYMKHFYGSDAESLFTADIINATKNYSWDEEKHRVICPTDERLEEEDEDGNDDEIFGVSAAEVFLEEKGKAADDEAAPSTEETTRPQPAEVTDTTGVENAYIRDDDSISTMGNSVVSTNTRTPPRTSGRSIATPNSQHSNISNVFTPITTDEGSVSTGVSGITLESMQEVQRQTLLVMSRILERLPETDKGAAAQSGTTGQANSAVSAVGDGR